MYRIRNLSAMWRAINKANESLPKERIPDLVANYLTSANGVTYSYIINDKSRIKDYAAKTLIDLISVLNKNEITQKEFVLAIEKELKTRSESD